MKLVIVESPTKAKTLNKFLGNDYKVSASMGQVGDIPANKMNIDIEHDFEPVYELSEGKGKVVAELQKLAKQADQIFLATDPDREGEAIAFHVKHILSSSVKNKDKRDFRRITFHQITKAAVEESIAHAGHIDLKMVDAQQARRVLDRLVGYSLSPVLWRKVRRGLSAGRVQSVALRLIVEREREVEAFKEQEYWDIKTLVAKQKEKKSEFWMELAEVNGKKAVEGKGDERKFLITKKEEAEPVLADLKKADYKVLSIVKKEKKSQPRPPFTTSTLQQAAANRFGWTGKRVMSVAQSLYEKGLITCHRIDSLHLAPEAVSMARDYVSKTYAANYLPGQARFFKTKSKSAQEAHEAIRPTDVSLVPTKVDGETDAADKKLYGLIWRRFLACQMADAIFDATTIISQAKGKKEYKLRASGAVMKFEGWKVLYGKEKKASTNANSEAGDEIDIVLPEVVEDEVLDYKDISAEQKFTQPPARYNDASLVKKLEELGIGRPSTYAPTISTLLGRGYMERLERRFHPTSVGMTVTDFLVKNFEEIMDYGFIAEMEGDLDKIAEGKKEWVPMLKDFWKPFDKKVLLVTDKADRVKIPVEKLGRKCPECGNKEDGELVVRSGRFGKFVSCSRFPECKYTEKLEVKIKGIKCEKCQKGDIVVKRTRTGRNFFGCNRYPDCDWASWTDPRTPETSKPVAKKASAKTKKK